MTLSMRSARALLVFSMVVLGGLSTAWAQEDGAGPARPVVPAGAAPSAAELTAGAQPGEADSAMRRPEQLMQKPSGFWTSGRPAVGGSYRYRLLGIGAAVMLMTAFMMVWVIRRHPRRNAEG
jgi:hypothetical protein